MSDAESHAIETLPEPDLSGRQLGDYKLLRRLGRGGMAEVYLAEQASLRRQVAMKVLKRRLARDENYVRRFHNEAQAAAALVHANIVQIYEVGCIDSIHFIAQEYVKGHNLKQLLTRRGPFDAALAASIMRQVAAALHKAATQRIIHRDIKPENILIAESGEVKVADFGLARVISEDGQTVGLTQVGVTMGTPLYMSPEQVEGRTVDPRSDIYSLGVTCYQMLAGRPPFDGDTALAVAVQHLKQAAQPLEELRPDLPAGLCRVVHKMLAKKPEERFQQAAELLRELRTLPIEGLDESWSSGLEDWTSGDLAALTDARLEATQRLGAIMKSELQVTNRRVRSWLLMPLVVFAGLMIGALAAWATAPKSLLELSPDKRPTIKQQPSAQEQYRHAYWLQTEQAWKAVEEYFPPNKATDAKDAAERTLYARRAKQRLAELYLHEDRLDDAFKLFTELANLEETEVQFRIYGLAGQAVVYAERGEKEAMAEKLAVVFPRRDQLNPDMREAIETLASQHQGRDRPPPSRRTNGQPPPPR